MTPARRRAARSGDHVLAGMPWLACVAGKFYFEVTVVEEYVGWAGTSFSGTKVGRDKEGASWGVSVVGDAIHRRAPPSKQNLTWS